MSARITTRAPVWLLLAALAGLPAYAQDPVHRSVEVAADASGSLRPVPLTHDGGDAATLRYWADPHTHRILRSSAHSLDTETVATDLHTPYGLGFDAETQSFLWTSSGDETVQKLVAGRSDVVTLQTSFEQPPTLDIAREGGKQAITLDGSTIVRVTEDGMSGEVTTEVLTRIRTFDGMLGLALDADTGNLYIGNAVGMMAYKLRLADNALSRLTYTDNAPPLPDADEGEPQ